MNVGCRPCCLEARKSGRSIAGRRSCWARSGIALLLLGFAAATVRAEDPVEPGPDIDAGLNPGTRRPLWELGLGVASIRLPDYRGSDQSRTYVLPLPYFVYRGTILKADRDGTRALLLDTGRVKVDVSVAASTPTHSNRDEARTGMANLAGTFEIGPNLNLALAASTTRRWKLNLRLPLRFAATLERSPRYVGNTFSPNLNLDLAGLGGGWNLGLLTGPLFADRRYHGYFYDVGAADATAIRPAFQARGGYAGWRALAATSRRIGNAWVGAFLRYDDLRGAAFDASPLVRSRSQLTAGIGVSWVLLTSTERVAASD